ncbi:MAG: glucose-6-phosphate isomerase [Myxococcota bacterium]
MKTEAVRLEAGGALAPPLAAAHGMRRAEVREGLRGLRGVLPELLGDEAPSGFLTVVEREEVLRGVVRMARTLRSRRFEDLIHVGIGGSALGAQTVLAALGHPLHNALPRAKRKGPRVHFVDNVDPASLGALLATVELRRTLVHVVSKSGSTVETAAGFQVLRAALERRVGARWGAHCVFTTGEGVLGELAERNDIACLPFPEDVGGRFSAFTPSGLLTPAIAGVDVRGLVGGARRFLRRIRKAPLERNPAAVAAAIAFGLAEHRGKPIQVLMPYADALEPLSRWYVQLAAESLGKRRQRGRRSEGVGPTPLPARGTTDQHAQVQLFVEGPPDKLVVFVSARRTRALRIPRGPAAPYLDGVDLGALLQAEQEGTQVALARAGRPTLRWELPAVSADALGQLLLALELQTAFQAALYGVNAYDQPGVEAGKVAAFALIGREGYAAERAAIRRERPPSWKI